MQHNIYQTFSFCWRNDLRIDPGMRRLISYLPLAISWGIWRVRNAYLFNNVRPTPASAIYHAVDVLRSISLLKPFILPASGACLAQRLGGLYIQQERRSIRVLLWEKPRSFCLNVDGSSLSTGVAGGGCVLRGQSGDVLFAASKLLGVATNVQAEIMALEYGLSLCQEKGFRDIQVDTDTMLLVQMLQGKAPQPWRHRHILARISALLNSTHSSLRHQFREVNAVADALAKHASSSETSTIFDHFTLPRQIKGLVRLDQIGYPYVRVR